MGGNQWHVSTVANALDSNPGTKESPLKSLKKAMSLAKPGDVVVISAGTYLCPPIQFPDGQENLPVTLKSAGDGRVILRNSAKGDRWISLGSYNVVDGIELHAGYQPQNQAGGFTIRNKKYVTIQNSRTVNCQSGITVKNSHYVTIRNCDISHSGRFGIALRASGMGSRERFDPQRKNAHIVIQNCYVHDAGWNTSRTEGYGFSVGGAVENLLIEHCQIDNNTGDGILYEDWIIHATARYNVIRGTGIAAIWIDNATMIIVENNFLAANNVAIWLSGEKSSTRLLNDFIAIRNNIIVHNNWEAILPSAYGRDIILITSNTRDVYFDNNTVAFNNCVSVVGVQNRQKQANFSNIHFRNNIFWENAGPVTIAPGVDPGGFIFANNLWSKPHPADPAAVTGDPLFADPNSDSPEGYKLTAKSAAIDKGMHLNVNHLDFWNAPRPHLPGAGAYDIGAHEYGARGNARIGLDLSTFPFPVPPFKVQYKVGPLRE